MLVPIEDKPRPTETLQEERDRLWEETCHQSMEIDDLLKTIRQMSDSCLCSRNTVGFDYGEIHPKLGKPKAGARWLTPVDLAGFPLRRAAGIALKDTSR